MGHLWIVCMEQTNDELEGSQYIISYGVIYSVSDEEVEITYDNLKHSERDREGGRIAGHHNLQHLLCQKKRKMCQGSRRERKKESM